MTQLGVVAEVAEKVRRDHINQRGFFEPFAEKPIQAVVDALDGLLSVLPRLPEVESVSEDSPIFFDVGQLPSYLEALASTMPSEYEHAIAEVLNGAGFSVDRLVESANVQRADFRVSDDKDGYVVEVKTKEDDPEEMERFRQALLANGEASRSTPMGRTNRMAGIFRKAAAQLRATPCGERDFKLVWFMAAGRDQSVQAKQFECTLYGRVDLITQDAKGVPCYYYSFNEFFGASDIDGAVVGLDEGVRLCVNSHGSRYEEFRRTKLYSLFEHHKVVLDPLALEAQGLAFIADCDIDRRHQLTVLRFLRQKYHMDTLIPFHGTTHISEAVIEIPLDDQDGDK